LTAIETLKNQVLTDKETFDTHIMTVVELDELIALYMREYQ
jgi:hypothetical protein